MPLLWSQSQSTQGLPEIESVEDCNSIMQQDLAILFKHSPTCPVSWMAHREIMQFRAQRPDVPLYLISVRRSRDVARHVAEATGIQHESPQVILFRGGKAITSASHDDITAGTISSFISTDSATGKISDTPSLTR